MLGSNVPYSSNVLAQAVTLVPLAVGYSAGLLDHFFLAGKFDFFVELDEQNPTQLILLFQNVSADEMVGTFTLYTEIQTECGPRW